MRVLVLAAVLTQVVMMPAMAQSSVAPAKPLFEIDGYVFGGAQWKASVPISFSKADDVGPFESLSTPLLLERNIPQILSPLTPEAQAFNAGAKNFAWSVWRLAGAPAPSDVRKDYLDGYALDFTPNPGALSGTLSFSFSMTDTSFYWANTPKEPILLGGTELLVFNWDMNAKRQITPDDIFAPGIDWRKAVADAAMKVIFLGPVPSNYPAPFALAGLRRVLADPQKWEVLQAGLRVTTAPYIVFTTSPNVLDASSAATVTIPWLALKPYLKSGGLVHNL